jgi:hypothetical protein
VLYCARQASGQLENRNWKRDKRKTPPFDYVEGWATRHTSTDFADFLASPSPLHKCIQRKVDDPGRLARFVEQKPAP